jgi:hypothetical protein
MSDPDPTTPTEATASSPAAKAVRRACNWHRVRVYLLSILLIFSMWAGASVVTIRLDPKRVVDKALAQLPFSSTTGKVYWINRRTLRIDDLKLGGFFYASSVTLTASPWGLMRHHVAKVQIDGGQLWTRPLYEQMDKMGKGDGKGLDWVIGRLEITHVGLGMRHPIVLNGLRLGEPDSSPEMKNERTVDILNVNITSTVDPTVNVFTFPLTRVRFTYSEFWHHHIREVDFIRPTMYLGEDLFWLTKQFKAESKSTSTQGPESPWVIGHFEVNYGHLAVNAFGQPVVRFPFFFDTKVDNVRLDQLDQISAKASIPINRFTQDYPDYKVRIENLTGNLFFSWPPSDANANNVVNVIKIEEVSWNTIAVKNVNTNVTFDPNGVYGKLSGSCEGGTLAGNFEFYYTKGFTWNADFFAQNINCQPIAEKIVGKYCKITGELDGSIAVQGKVTEILNCTGLLELPKPGMLEFKSMDELLDRIPADMMALKRDAIKIAINSFQKYPYDTGELKLNYTPAGGLSSLKLTGPNGKRNFEVVLHPYSLTDGTK